MPACALTAVEVAAAFGHKKAWIYENWQRLVAEGKLPPPLIEAGHLVWDKAQVWAYRDFKIPAKIRPLVAAHRAAEEAAMSAPADYVAGDVVERDRAELDRIAARRLAKQEG
jgi:hypothetical protein